MWHKLIAALVFLAATAAQAAYDAPEAAPAALDAAKVAAAKSGRAILLVFGANWCKDCRVLETEMQNEALAKPLAERYLIVKINVGDFDRNMELGVRFGVPIKKGIPTVAVISPDEKVLAATTAGELADARHMSSEGIRGFLLNLPPAK